MTKKRGVSCMVAMGKGKVGGVEGRRGEEVLKGLLEMGLEEVLY